MSSKLVKFKGIKPLDTAKDTLVQMYKDLGWDSKKEKLDPKDYTLNEVQWKEIADQLDEIEKGGGWLMFHYGPSGRNEVPYGKIRITKRKITS